jgi:hypothetical protein
VEPEYENSILAGASRLFARQVRAAEYDQAKPEKAQKWSRLNTADDQAEIKRLIESCCTPPGGYKGAIVRRWGVVIGKGHQLPSGWKLDLIEHGNVEAVRRAVMEYKGAGGKPKKAKHARRRPNGKADRALRAYAAHLRECAVSGR